MIKAKFETAYRTYPVPEGLTPDEMVAFARGVDAVLEVTEPEKKVSRLPAYRYFHDDDRPDLWYRRVPVGDTETTDEIFRNYGGFSVPWMNGHSTLSFTELDALGWVEVQYEELPAKAQDHEQYL